MPVYNAELYVREAIVSIINQTYSEFEFIIINDGSKDSSKLVIESIKDERIVFINHEINAGLVNSLNEGLKLARGKYIARMDNDDIAYPDRFIKQLRFMEDNPSVGVCGTAFQTFGNIEFSPVIPCNDSDIREFMLVHNPIGHPTVMMRNSLIKEHKLSYIQDATPAEDYRMWYEFSKICLLSNLPDILLNYRIHEQQLSSSMRITQNEKVNEIRWLQLKDKGFVLSKTEINLYCQLLDQNVIFKLWSDKINVVLLMNKILRQNIVLKAFPEEWFERIFGQKIKFIITPNNKFNFKYLKLIFIMDSRIRKTVLSYNQVKSLIKSLIFYN